MRIGLRARRVHRARESRLPRHSTSQGGGVPHRHGRGGANDARLAIELDGHEFHGPDRWQADISRQRALERAGWVFWRCFASTRSLRRQDVLNDLLAKMHALGIEALGAIERVPALAEYREWNGERVADIGDEITVAASVV